MRKTLFVVDALHKSTLTVGAKDRLSQVSGIMSTYGLKHVPVSQNNRIIGIISKRDIQRLGFGYVYDGKEDVELGILDMLQADQVMTPMTFMVSLDTTIAEVVEIFSINDLIALPVIDQSNLVGTLAIHDVLRLLTQQSHK